MIVDGMHGRGTVVKREGRRLTIYFRNGEFLSRDQKMVHKVTADYKSPYQSRRT